MDTPQKLFLLETSFCDCCNPAIQDIVAQIKSEVYNNGTYYERLLAVRIFNFVRDEIKYTVGNWHRKASETLLEKRGTCTNSANLMVAMLRIAGIPAGYRVMRVDGKEYFGPITPSILKQYISDSSIHIYVCVYLDGRWVKCDPSDDHDLAIGTQHINPQSTLVEWDGVSDAILKLDPAHVISDTGPLWSIDDVFQKPSRHQNRGYLVIANAYIQFLREHGQGIHNIEEIEKKFKKWLAIYSKKYYIYYHMLKFPTINKILYEIFKKNKK